MHCAEDVRDFAVARLNPKSGIKVSDGAMRRLIQAVWHAHILSYRLECNISRKDFEPLNQHNLVVFFEIPTKSGVSNGRQILHADPGDAASHFHEPSQTSSSSKNAVTGL